MTIIIKGKITKKKLDDALKKAEKTRKKGFDASKYLGIFDWGGEEPVTIQKKMRSEWD